MKTVGELDIEAYVKRLNEYGEWISIVPVSGVTLTDAVNNEFRIKRVLLVDRRKFPRIRRRLGISQRISQFKKRYFVDFFDSADTFAVFRDSGFPKEIRIKCLRIVEDELSVLASSQLGFKKRRYGSYPAIKGEHATGSVDDLLLNTQDARKMLRSRLVGKIDTLRLDAIWKSFQKEVFFYRLLKILNKEVKVSRTWRDDLERAAILVGQSRCSSDIAQAFLWNIIALELLLTGPGDKYTDVLPKRIEAFLGWVGFWTVENYEDKITEIYKKRCAFVHSGKREDITVKDLLFTDDLLLNLLSNLVHHVDQFPSKQAVIDFAKKVEAEHILGIKPRVRPKTLRFISRSYTEKDYQEI